MRIVSPDSPRHCAIARPDRTPAFLQVSRGQAGAASAAESGRFALRCALGALALTVVAVAPAQENAAFNLHQVAEGVFVHQGVHVPFEDVQHDDVANIGFIIGDDCVAVIDSGGSLRTGRALHNAVREQTDRPVCYVINTHGHFDHVLGNAEFRGDSPRYVGHEDLRDAMDASRDFFLEQFHADLGTNPGPDVIIGPDMGVAGRMEINLGNRVLELTAHPAAHSYTDLSVLDRKTGTLWLGDLLFMERIPALDGSLLGWLRLLEELQSVPAGRVVPGHGPPSGDWPRSADAQIAYLRNLRDEVRAGIAKGLFMEEVLDSAGSAEKLKWRLHEQHHGRNVSKAYTELEWE